LKICAAGLPASSACAAAGRTPAEVHAQTLTRSAKAARLSARLLIQDLQLRQSPREIVVIF
jgi:hypothetical protein